MIVITPENEQIVIKGMYADKVTNFNPKYREKVTNRRPEENIQIWFYYAYITWSCNETISNGEDFKADEKLCDFRCN